MKQVEDRVTPDMLDVLTEHILQQPIDLFTTPEVHAARQRVAAVIEESAASAEAVLRKNLESWRKSVAQRARRARERANRKYNFHLPAYYGRMAAAKLYENTTFGEIAEKEYDHAD